jgi:hypothetical protein
MDPDQLREHVLDLLRPLCEPLHDYIETASANAGGHLEAFDISQRGWQHTHLARAHLDHQLKVEPVPGFSVLEPRNNGRLLLAAAEGTTLRVLHVGPHDTVPAPGCNRARIRYYQQQQLSIPTLGLASALLGLWSVDDDGLAAFRVVRPIGRWRYGARARVDMDLMLPRTPAGLDELEFVPDDTDLELQVPSEELAEQFIDHDNEP